MHVITFKKDFGYYCSCQKYHGASEGNANHHARYENLEEIAKLAKKIAPKFTDEDCVYRRSGQYIRDQAMILELCKVVGIE